ncbi:diacylglycerol/lipid kinase family protein [Actinomyces marmotae]|nr:diacylglycerol kinase family protein [Actinomyces marmotae]
MSTTSSARAATPEAPRSADARARREVAGRAMERVLAVMLILAFAIWTLLVVTGRTAHLDTAFTRSSPLLPRSAGAQIAEAYALLTHPALITAAIVGLALWSFKERMRRLALALLMAAAGIPVHWLISTSLGIKQPHSHLLDSLSVVGGAYPNAQIAAVTIASSMLLVLTRAHRRPTSDMAVWWLAGIAAIIASCYSQWAMGIASASDQIGGILWGAAVTNTSLALGGVDTILSSWARLGLPTRSVDKRAAVIYNPTKFFDLSLLRRRIEAEVLAAGWLPTQWLETTPEDPGRAMARQALEHGVDLVLVAGGDGTVRAVAGELAGTGMPMALLPSGTGNLLARNLLIPLDTDAALRLALSGSPTTIDLVRATWDDGEEIFAVMAGLGLDAQIMADTKDELKRVIRAGAYAVAAMQHASPRPFRAAIALDGAAPEEHDMVMALLGNVGTITGGMTILPRATPTDGRVDLLLARPDRVVDWARMGAMMLAGRVPSGLTLAQASRVSIRANEPVPFELDGDIAGTTRALDIEVIPGALSVIAPPHP